MMEKTVLSTIRRYHLLDGVSTLCVALSGGADSMTLLHVLWDLRKTFGFTLSAAHLNHMIRGAEADRDEAFVKAACEKLGVPIITERQDVPAYARINKISEELAAREVRYRFFESLPCDAVATAHTADDHLETVLLNLTRGATLKGLCGIPPKRERFIRPMIDCTREQVEHYCDEKKIDFVTDSTNLSDAYTRNRIRHYAVPVLKAINPAAALAARRMSANLAKDEQYLSDLAGQALSDRLQEDTLLLDGIEELPEPVLRRVVKLFFERQLPDIPLDNQHMEQLCGLTAKSGRVSLPGNHSAVSAGRRLYVEKKSGDGAYTVTLQPVIHDFFTNNQNVHNLLLKNSLDCDKIIGKSVVRTRLPGDAMRLAGTNGTKTLKKLFNEYHIPVSLRAVLPVIADEKGVIWVSEIGAAARCAVTKNTQHAVIIQVSRVNDRNKGD